MKKGLRALEAVSSISLMLSKYFLSLGSIWGWWLSILGYILISFFNVKIKLRALAGIVAGLAILSAYGLYKWAYSIHGLQLFDWIIITISFVLSIVLVIKEAKSKKPYWVLQTIATIAFAFAFIALGMKSELGWYALLVGHINNTYLYYKKGAYIIGVMQIMSIVIVLCKIF